jgi:uncharacterized membrane-anchored protein
MTRVPIAAMFALLCSSVAAQGPQITPEQFEAQLGYQGGLVTLGQIATINVPASFRFIGPDGSRRLLTEAWGNPSESADRVLGMLIPAALSPLTKDGWGIVITYDEDGYVNDSGATSIDYGKLLKQMQDSVLSANEERRKRGFPPIRLAGWAEPPTYDASSHKMYWAKDLVFGTNEEHTLNYNIRVLGRRGVLVLNAVARMDQLPVVRNEARNVISAVNFSEGHRYSDYLPGKDRAAAYGVAGLILGAAAAKAGFFKVLLVGILAFKKLIVAAAIGLIGAVRKFFRRRDSDAVVTQPSDKPIEPV